jgi:methionine-rich copper-binding protein CopC
MYRLLIALLLAAAPLGAAVPALAGDQASPQVVSSDPEEGEEFHDGAPGEVSITFSEPLDPGSSLRVFDDCGGQVDAGNQKIEINTITVQLDKKPSGTYQAYYNAKTIRGVTGETTGILSFVVHGGPSCGNKSGGGHGGHEGGDGGHQGGGDPDHEGNGGGHNASGPDHDSSTGHSASTSHSSSGADHSTPGHSGGGSQHGEGNGKGHGSGKGRGDHGPGNHGNDKASGGNVNTAAPGPFASGESPAPAPQGEAILIALLACIAIGAAGGWMARMASSFNPR